MDRVALIVGTRPEAIKMAPIILELQAQGVRHDVIATGQHGALADNALADFGLRPSTHLPPLTGSLTDMAGQLLSHIGEHLLATKPSILIVQGDTTSAAMGAIAAHYQAIPVAHVEAGLRSGSLAAPWPEEANRRMISAIADLHCAPTEAAAAALRLEGIEPARVHVTGNTCIDALFWMRRRMGQGKPPSRAVADVLIKAAGRRLLLVTMHRRESHGAGIDAVATAMKRLAQRNDLHIAATLHPNPAVGPALAAQLARHEAISLLPPLDYPDFVLLLDSAFLALSDSGGVQEEAPALATPVLVLRDRTERREAIDSGVARLVGCDADAIVNATIALLDDPALRTAMASGVSPYGDGHAAPRIVALLSDLLRAGDHFPYRGA